MEFAEDEKIKTRHTQPTPSLTTETPATASQSWLLSHYPEGDTQTQSDTAYLPHNHFRPWQEIRPLDSSVCSPDLFSVPTLYESIPPAYLLPSRTHICTNLSASLSLYSKLCHHAKSFPCHRSQYVISLVPWEYFQWCFLRSALAIQFP